MSRVLVAAGVIRAGRRVRDLSVFSTATAPAHAPASGAPTQTSTPSSPWCFRWKQPAGIDAETGAAGLDVLGGALLVSGSGSLLALMLLITAAQGWGSELVAAEILSAAAVIGYRAHRGGWRRWWTPVWRFLVLTGLLLAAAAILLPLCRGGRQEAWQWDIAGWQLASAVALALGLLEVPVLADALLERDRATWVLRAEHVVAGWVPFAGLLVCYPYAPVWAGRRHGLAEVLPGLVCLVTVAAVVWVQARIEAGWLVRARAVRAAGDVLDPGTHVGIQLGRLTDLYGPEVTDDLTVALWLVPLGVRVRVATEPRMVIEGLTTEKSGDSIRIGSQWINTFDHMVTGLEILADERTPAERERSRTPALRPASHIRQPATEDTSDGLVVAGDAPAAAHPAITIRDQNVSDRDSRDSNGRGTSQDPLPDLESRSVSASAPQ